MSPPPKLPELEAILEARDFLRRLARSLVLDEHRAEDLVQETCARALERPPREASALRGWMARVLQRLAIDQRTRELARPTVEARAARPERAAEEERDLELESAVLDAVRGLRQPYRSAIYLRYYRGLTPRAIARELALPEATVKTRLRRGLEMLREDLDRRHGGRRDAWCSALVVIALPELGPAAALTLHPTTLLQGIALVNKPLVASLTAASLVAIAGVAWLVKERGTSTASRPGSDLAIAPQTNDRADGPGASTPEAARPASAPGESARSVLGLEQHEPERVASSSDSGIRGRVIDEAGNPIADALVRSDASDLPFLDLGGEMLPRELAPAEVLTGRDGRFVLPVSEDGPLSLSISAAGHAPSQKEVTGYYDLRTDVGDIVLASGASIAGRVLDPSGDPVAGAAILVEPTAQPGHFFVRGMSAGREVARTDAQGRFELDRLAVGPWSFSVRAADHPLEVVSGETKQAGERVANLEVRLRPGATIAGRIVGGPAAERPALWVRAGARESERSQPGGILFMTSDELVLGEVRAAVAPDGSFHLRGLEPGVTYRLCAYDQDSPAEGTAHTRIVEAAAGASGVELPWSTGAAILVKAVDARTGEAVLEYALEARIGFGPMFLGRAVQALHRPEGRARVDDLRVPAKRDSANVSVHISAEGYAPWSGEFEVQRDRELDLGTVRLDPVPRLRLRVVDAEGRPIAGAHARLTELGAHEPGGGEQVSRRSVRIGARGATSAMDLDRAVREGRTDENGEVALSSLPGARARLDVRARRFADFRSEAIDLPTGADLESRVVLSRGAVAEVIVLDADGLPQRGARVLHRGVREDSEEGAGLALPFQSEGRVTDSEGRVWFRNLTAGRHGFRLDDGRSSGFVMQSGSGSSSRVASLSFGSSDAPFSEFDFADGETRSITLNAGSSSSLFGTLTEAGVPLGDAELRLVTEGSADPMAMFSGGGPSARTDSQGTYSFEEVEPGRYELVVTHPSRAMAHRQRIELSGAGQRQDVDLDVTIVEGRVKDGDGRPVAGARVRAERVRAAGERRGFAVMVMAGGPGGGSDLVVAGGEDGPVVETDADGRYALRGLSPGVQLQVRAEASGCSPARSEAFELGAFEKRTGFDLRLEAGGSIAVEVFQDGAVPQVSALLRLRREDPPALEGPPRLQLSDAEGRASFRDLPPGRYSVVASPLGAGPGEELAPQEVIVRPREESRLRIDLP